MIVIFGIQIHLFCHGELMALLMGLPVLGAALVRFRAALAQVPVIGPAAAALGRGWARLVRLVRRDPCACGHDHAGGEKHA